MSNRQSAEPRYLWLPEDGTISLVRAVGGASALRRIGYPVDSIYHAHPDAVDPSEVAVASEVDGWTLVEECWGYAGFDKLGALSAGTEAVALHSMQNSKGGCSLSFAIDGREVFALYRDGGGQIEPEVQDRLASGQWFQITRVLLDDHSYPFLSLQSMHAIADILTGFHLTRPASDTSRAVAPCPPPG